MTRKWILVLLMTASPLVGTYAVAQDKFFYRFKEGVLNITNDDAESEPNLTPEAFSINANLGADPSENLVSNPVTLSGFDAPISISANNGARVSVDGGAFAPDATIAAGQSFRVAKTAPAEFDRGDEVTITAGGVSAAWNISTRAQNTTADPFSIAPANNVNPGQTVTSAAVTPTGYESTVSINAVGGLVSVDGGAFAANAMISEGQSFNVRGVASASFDAVTNVNVTVGSGTPASFVVRTRAQDTAPNVFSIPAITNFTRSAVATSNPVTPTGFDGTVNISATGGQISVNNGPWVSNGTITIGQSFRVQLTASPDYQTTRTATVTVGSGANNTANFSVTTQMSTHVWKIAGGPTASADTPSHGNCSTAVGSPCDHGWGNISGTCTDGTAGWYPGTLNHYILSCQAR